MLLLFGYILALVMRRVGAPSLFFYTKYFFPPGARTPKHWMPWGEEMWDHYTANFNSSGEIKCLFRLLAASDVFPWLLNPPATTDWKRVEGKHPLELSYLKTT